MTSICVIGLGYIGLPTASLLANNGFTVLGVDINARVVNSINSGRNHIEEVGLRTLVEAAVSSGRLRASVEPSASDVFIIAVPTPIDDQKQPDLTFVFDAARAILPHLQHGNLVVLESTVPPGTTRSVAQYVHQHRPDLSSGNGGHVLFAHCPERVLPGKILKELVENDRVVGGLDEAASNKAAELYGRIVSGTIYKSDATTAEMVKLCENTFRDVNIALANELAVICRKLGINVWEVIGLANKHPRVSILKPGPGVGGHCIAVDPWFIAAGFPEDARVISAARLRNDAMPAEVVEVIASLIADEPVPKIACLGASYKGNVGDPRNSPAMDVFNMLCKRYPRPAEVVLNDMHVTDSSLPLVGLDVAFQNADLIVVLSDHKEYAVMEPGAVAWRMRRRLVLDTRNALDAGRWREAGFEVYVLGDGSQYRKENVEISA